MYKYNAWSFKVCINNNNYNNLQVNTFTYAVLIMQVYCASECDPSRISSSHQHHELEVKIVRADPPEATKSLVCVGLHSKILNSEL